MIKETDITESDVQEVLDLSVLDLDPVPDDQYYRLINILTHVNVLYSKVFALATPYWTNSDKIPTAAVSFDMKGVFLAYMFNRKFWESLTEYQRLFIICHETLHIMLNHGARFNNVEEKYKNLTNTAADIVINEMLVSVFKFNRKYLGTVAKEGCWIDTVFSKLYNTAQQLGFDQEIIDSLNPDNVKRGMNFEYYLRLMTQVKDQLNELVEQGKIKFFDDHSCYNPGDSNEIHDALDGSLDPEEVGEEAVKELEKNTEESDSYQKQAGGEVPLAWRKIEVKKPAPRRTWLTLMKKLTKRVLKETKDLSWKVEHRRFLEMFRGKSIHLPGLAEVDELTIAKQKIWLFMDVSGSCYNYSPRFLKAAKTIPEDKFEVKSFVFDTRVIEIDYKKTDKLPYGGGTAFCIIEKAILDEMRKTNTSYPALVVVVTDGYGTKVEPKYPKRWHVLFTEDSMYTECFPDECNFYPLNYFDGEQRR